MTRLGRCMSCGQREYVQNVPVGEDFEDRCRHCAADRWRRVYAEPSLLAVLDAIDAYLDEHADMDHDVDEGQLVYFANDAARLLAELRAAREAL